MQTPALQDSDSEKGEQPPLRDRMRVPVPQVTEQEPQAVQVPQVGGGGGGGGGGGLGGGGDGIGVGVGVIGGDGAGPIQPHAACAKGCPRSSATMLEPPSITRMPATADRMAPCDTDGMVDSSTGGRACQLPQPILLSFLSRGNQKVIQRWWPKELMSCSANACERFWQTWCS